MWRDVLTWLKKHARKVSVTCSSMSLSRVSSAAASAAADCIVQMRWSRMTLNSEPSGRNRWPASRRDRAAWETFLPGPARRSSSPSAYLSGKA